MHARPPKRSSLARPLVGAVVAACALAGAAVANRKLDLAAQRNHDAALREAAGLARARLGDAITAEIESLRLTAHNAASNPRLLAAIKGRVDRRTFEDLFANEPWWRPYRSESMVAVTYASAGTPVYDEGLIGSGLSVAAFVNKASYGSAHAELTSTGDAAFAVASTAVGQGPTGGFLTVARGLGGPVLERLAARAGAPVTVKKGELVVQPAAGAVRAPAPAVPRAIVWGAGVLVAIASAWIALRRRPRAVDASDPNDGRVLGPMKGVGSAPRRRATTFGGSLPDHLSSPLLGRYALVERIGEGGMAEIYSAVSFGTGGFRRPFVIKRLRPEMISNQQAVAHFIDEANLGASLLHPNIVPVFDFGETDGECYMVQEYVHGRDLGRLSRRLDQTSAPPLSLAVVLHVAHQVLRALEYAHARRTDTGEPLNIVHRDVTPDNVIASIEGEVKLLDFGIVKTDQARVTRTDLGLVKGNVDFMSPEQARGKPVDARSDLFSLGLLLYTLLARTNLYGGGTVYDRLSKAATGPGADELERLAALPAPFDELLERALRVDPDRRFTSAGEFRTVIEMCQATMGLDANHGARELAVVLERAFGQDLRGEHDRLTSVDGPALTFPAALDSADADASRASR